MIEVRPATAADVETILGHRSRLTVIALVAIEDGEVVSLGGLAREPYGYRAFWNIKPGHEAAMRSMAVLRAVKRVMAIAADRDVPIVAVGDNPALLERLGFENIEKDCYQWVNTLSISPLPDKLSEVSAARVPPLTNPVS